MVTHWSRFFIIGLLPIATLVGCVTTPMYEPPESVSSPEVKRKAARPKASEDLETQLGMNRAPSDLGFTEKSFNPCNYGASQSCEFRYYTIVQFQLLCRDTEGTVSTVPRSLSPIVHPNINWSLAGQSGGTFTDRNGYGQVRLISAAPTRGKRLVLKKGRNFVGLDVSEVRKIILPRNWCDQS